MKRAINKAALFAVVAALGAFCAPAADSETGHDVIWWLIDDTATVSIEGVTDPVGIKNYLSGTTEYNANNYLEEGSGISARIRVTSPAEPADGYLVSFFPGDASNSSGTYESGKFGYPFEDPSGRWGAVYPGNQSVLAWDNDAELGVAAYDYSGTSPEYTFIVEIGNVVYDETTGLTWTDTYLASEGKSYSDLYSDGFIIKQWNLNTPTIIPWVPHFSVVPEPSGGLLTMFGMALLALRRRRRVVA